MTTHHLQLAAAPFEAIASHQKTIESRLYDEKRKAIAIGNELIFTNRENPEQALSAVVTGLLRYQTFHDLFTHNDPRKFGGESVEQLENQINEFYNIEDQKLDGVLGIEFEIAS